MDEPPRVIAYRIPSVSAMELVSAPRRRSWLEATPAARLGALCAPMALSNSYGWAVLNAGGFDVCWDGGAGLEAIKIRPTSHRPVLAFSTFGHGRIGWSLPYVFRTCPGWNIELRGVPNWPRAGVTPLEGQWEADQYDGGLTITWQITVPGLWVAVATNEPIALLTVRRRGDLAGVSCEIRNLREDADIAAGYEAWARKRRASIEAIAQKDWSELGAQDLDRDYLAGRTTSGCPVASAARRQRVDLPEFVDRCGDGEP